MAALTGIAIGAMAVGGGMALHASAEKAKAQRKMGDYQSDMYGFNSSISKLQQQDALERGEKEASAFLLKGRQTIASQKVALAAQGVDVSTGSAAEIQEDTAAQAAIGAMQIRNNAWREAWGYKVQSINYDQQGFIAKTSAQNEARSTMLTGVANAVGTAGSMAGGMR